MKNQYIETFQLNSREEINEFIFDNMDWKKADELLPFILPHKIINYIETFKLRNKDLINKFIGNFCKSKQVDEYIKFKMRLLEERELGIDVFRQAHEAEILQRQERMLKRKFDNKNEWN